VVSLAANTVTVKSVAKKSKRIANFVIPSDVKILRNGQPGAVKDIQKGDSISVTFSTKKGSTNRRVTQVDIGGSASQ
jgi:hypothetical protein